eukprot:scaffold11197_cov267-Chaetoceros_neogracile.AAC.2
MAAAELMQILQKVIFGEPVVIALRTMITRLVLMSDVGRLYIHPIRRGRNVTPQRHGNINEFNEELMAKGLPACVGLKETTVSYYILFSAVGT